MVLLELVLASAAAAGEEKSQAAFYLAGGLLAAWGVLLGVLGTVRPSLPSGQGGARAIMGLTGLLVVGACVSAALTG